MNEVLFLKNKARQIRTDVINMIYASKTGHTGGSLSDTDILTVLYYSIMNIDPGNSKYEDRDRFILSKGHSVESFYCILADKGFFPKEKLRAFSKFGSQFIGHPNNKIPGVEVNTGALGHGLSVGVGMALAGKMNKKSYRVFTVMGDGEQAEGSVWEAAMSAAHYKLDNLVGIIDRNKLQISGRTEDVMGLEPLSDKWISFGWEVVEVDGNNIEELLKTFKSLSAKKDKPTLILAHTIKGKGVSYMENVAKWHHGVPSEEEYEIAINELTQNMEESSNE